MLVLEVLLLEELVLEDLVLEELVLEVLVPELEPDLDLQCSRQRPEKTLLEGCLGLDLELGPDLDLLVEPKRATTDVSSTPRRPQCPTG